MIELASVIQDLRSELERAVVAGTGQVLRFELGPIELEVTLGIERSAEADAKVKFWVVEMGARGAVDTTNTQRVKLVLTPRLGATMSSAFVGGQAEPREE